MTEQIIEPVTPVVPPAPAVQDQPVDAGQQSRHVFTKKGPLPERVTENHVIFTTETSGDIKLRLDIKAKAFRKLSEMTADGENDDMDMLFQLIDTFDDDGLSHQIDELGISELTRLTFQYFTLIGEYMQAQTEGLGEH